jgi:glycosyltransferase involved in cell wall biosynthesis
MKITFVSPQINLSGGSRVISIYAQLLQDSGHEVTVIAAGKTKKSIKRRIIDTIKRVETKKADDTHFRNAGYRLIIVRNKDSVPEKYVPDADVIIATWWETAYWVAEYGENKGKKFYFVQHDETHNKSLPQEKVESSYRLPLQIITIANWLQQLMAEKYGAADVSMVSNSVDSEFFSVPEREKNKIPTLGFLFSTTASKGVSTAIKVVARLKAAYPELRIVSFGTSPPKLYPLPEYVELHIRPRQEKIREIYGMCDLWLCCSRLEGFGLPILEAMSCRTPVVSTRSGGPEDIVSHGVNGYLCDVDDVECLTNRSMEILNMSQAQWKSMSDSARHHATRYTWPDAAGHFERILKKRS